MSKSDNLERNTRTNWTLTFVSRVTGLIRDGAIARIFGVDAFSSAFYFAFLIPNLFRRLFGEGALAAAFLPSYSKLVHEHPEQAKAFASLTISKLVLLLGVIAIIGEGILWWMISLQQEPSPALQLAMVMLPYMPLVCSVAILAAMLHVHDRFGPPATAPIILNGCMIAAAFLFVGVFDNPLNHMMMIGIAVVVAGVIQVIWSLLALRQFNCFTKKTDGAHAEFGVMLKRMIPMIIGLGTLQINTLVDGLIASWTSLFGSSFFFGLQYPLSDGAMASLSWAQRLYQFPLGVFGIAVATAIYPLLAKQSKDPDTFTSTIHRGLRLVIYIGLPASAGLIIVRNPLASAVFQGVNFTASDAILVGTILLGYAPAVWAYSMTQVLAKGFYAKDDAMTPVKVALICVLLNFVLNITLIWTPLGTAGLAWSTAICSVIQVCLLLSLFGKHVKKTVNADVIRSWGSTAFLTLVMSAVVAILVDFLWNPEEDWAHSCVVLATSVVAGMAVVGVGSVLLRKPELHWILGRHR
ncbi:murein biosynthesis integral membrane protein MurJ [bacterium]|nr:murein biosynthesis integral membrane protein MurJ [bacterium]